MAAAIEAQAEAALAALAEQESRALNSNPEHVDQPIPEPAVVPPTPAPLVDPENPNSEVRLALNRAQYLQVSR